VVEPAVGAVTGGVDLYVVTPVGRAVGQVRGSRGRSTETGPGTTSPIEAAPDSRPILDPPE